MVPNGATVALASTSPSGTEPLTMVVPAPTVVNVASPLVNAVALFLTTRLKTYS